MRGHFSFAFLDRRISVFAQERACPIAFLTRLGQRHLRVRTKHKALFLVGKPVFQAPRLEALFRDEKVEAARISQFVILLARRGLSRLQVGERHDAPFILDRCPRNAPGGYELRWHHIGSGETKNSQIFRAYARWRGLLTPPETEGWWAMTGSNRRHSRCKRDALPTELIAPTRSRCHCLSRWASLKRPGHRASPR